MRFASDKESAPPRPTARVCWDWQPRSCWCAGASVSGLTGTTLPPRRGNAQIIRLAQAWSEDAEPDYTPPEHRAMIPHARAVFISDFLGPMDEVELALTKAADRGVRGVILQVFDPSEESFPYRGRTIFESVGGTTRHETLKAGDLRDRYLDRLAQRKDALTSAVPRNRLATGPAPYRRQRASGSVMALFGRLDGGMR